MMKRYPLSLLLALAITVVSLIPVPETPLDDVPFHDKWAHFLMYGALGAVAYFESLRQKPRPSLGRMLVVGLCQPALLGGLLELGQAYLTTTRSGDWIDAAANATGAVLATLVALPFMLRRR